MGTDRYGRVDNGRDTVCHQLECVILVASYNIPSSTTVVSPITLRQLCSPTRDSSARARHQSDSRTKFSTRQEVCPSIGSIPSDVLGRYLYPFSPTSMGVLCISQAHVPKHCIESSHIGRMFVAQPKVQGAFFSTTHAYGTNVPNVRKGCSCSVFPSWATRDSARINVA